MSLLLFFVDGVRQASVRKLTANFNINTDIRDIRGGGSPSDVTSVTADWSISHQGRGGRSEGGVRAIVIEIVVRTRNVEKNPLLAVLRYTM